MFTDLFLEQCRLLSSIKDDIQDSRDAIDKSGYVHNQLLTEVVNKTIAQRFVLVTLFHCALCRIRKFGFYIEPLRSGNSLRLLGAQDTARNTFGMFSISSDSEWVNWTAAGVV